MYGQSVNGDDNEPCATESFNDEKDVDFDLEVELEREFNALDNEQGANNAASAAGVDCGQLGISYAGQIYFFDNISHEMVN